MKIANRLFGALVIMAVASNAQAGVIDTDFTEATIAATGISLDQPDTANGEITLDTVNDRLVLTSHNATNMWTSRADAPIAYVTSPNTSSWYVETDIVLSTPGNDYFQGGLTVYADSDGALPDFAYYFNNWPNSGSRRVQVQGLGTNIPNVSSAGIAATNVILRIEYEQDGGAGGLDRYTFKYDLLDGNGLQTLTTFDADIPNGRVGAFTKSRGNVGAGDDLGDAVALNSFTVVPEPSTVVSIIIGLVACGLRRRR